jgi:transcriptional antiterminator RfaH
MSYWCCLQLEPHRERLALHCLSTVNDFEVYSPRIRAPRPQRRRRRQRAEDEDPTQPLFPGYCFALIVLQWHAARWSPGVLRIVLDGSLPAKVPDNVIADLRARERNGAVELPKSPEFRPGDRVKILGGPFGGHWGLYAGMKPHERVEVLLSFLGSQQRVTLRRDAVAAPTDADLTGARTHKSRLVSARLGQSPLLLPDGDRIADISASPRSCD